MMDTWWAIIPNDDRYIAIKLSNICTIAGKRTLNTLWFIYTNSLKGVIILCEILLAHSVYELVEEHRSNIFSTVINTSSGLEAASTYLHFTVKKQDESHSSFNLPTFPWLISELFGDNFKWKIAFLPPSTGTTAVTQRIYLSLFSPDLVRKYED